MTNAPTGTPKAGTMTIVIAALMLFSMFFGAGNLIFPPMVGVNSGTNFWPAILGFLAAGVVLPVLAVIAVSISGRSVRDIGNHGGKIFGIVFSIIAYLSIGAFYALPRTGAVSMETAITPLTGWEGPFANAAFNATFFLIALAVSWKPNSIIDTLGKFLTPALVFLLAVLIILGTFGKDRMPGTPTEAYDGAAFVTGLFEGYNTMDAIAGLAFSIVIVTSMQAKGFKPGKQAVSATIIATTIAGALLAVIYLGLGYMGQTMPNAASYESGANLLADAAHMTMGSTGQIVFSLIVLLACMTTAVGLITSTSEFFAELAPKTNYHMWAVIFTALSILLAIQGLDTVLAIAVPFIIFLYPPAIALIFLTLLQPLVKGAVTFFWGYRLALWMSVLWSAISVISDLGWLPLGDILALSPGQAVGVGWVLPTLIAFAVGVVIDFATKSRANA